MKKYVIILFLLISTGFLIMQSCVKKEFETPQKVVPSSNLTINATIMDLKNYLPAGDLIKKIDTNFIIEGYVSANDESGNLYKTMYIQDSTTGIEIKLNASYLNTIYKIGQKIKIKCQGLYIGTYGGVKQLGYLYAGSVGRIPEVYIKDHIFADGYPDKSKIKADTIYRFDSIKPYHIGKLICFKNVYFEDFRKPFVQEPETDTDRPIVDSLNNNTVIVRTSSYASFAKNLIPKGVGTITGVLSEYSGTKQLYIRDLKDLVLDPSILVSVKLFEEMFSNKPQGWTIYSVSSNKNWEWSSQYNAMVGNGYGGDAPSNDWLVTPAIDLSNVQDAVLNFRTWTKYNDYGTTEPLQVFALTDYSGSGDPSQATRIKLQNYTLSANNSGAWASSGDVSLADFKQVIHIAFWYRSSGTSSNSAATWEVDAVVVKAKQ